MAETLNLARPKQRFIAVATPSLGAVPIEWTNAMIALRCVGWPRNIGFITYFTIDSEGGEVAECRNRIVCQALDFCKSETREISHIFWVDDDVIVDKDSLKTLLRHDRPIASGVYFTKEEDPDPLIIPGRNMGMTPYVPDRAFESWAHGMGLTLVRMDVYRRMMEETDLGRDKYGLPAWYRTIKGGEEAPEDGVPWDASEDVYFLDRASRIGYHGFVDTSRQTFGWHMDIKTRQGYPMKQYAQRMTGKPIVWETAEGPMSWSS